MKVTLYMAISVDGFITRGENDSDWVSEKDWDQFYAFIKKSDAVIMGRKTREQFADDEFPIKGPINIVITTDQKLHQESNSVIFTDRNPGQIIALAQERKWGNILIIGGAHTNQTFLEAGLIDEIIVSVHPLIIGADGLKLFGTKPQNINLDLISSKTISNELVQLHYQVIK